MPPQCRDPATPSLRDLRVTIWGARGSLPASGAAYARYGGETCAVEAQADGRTLLFDAGTGLVPMGKDLARRGVRDVDLFLTHLHYDHVMGLPFFALLHDPAACIRIHLGGATDVEARARLSDYFRPPFFPVPLAAFPAEVTVRGLPDGIHDIRPDMTLTAWSLTHPGGATGYRLEARGMSFAYVTDFEQDGGAGDEAVLALARNADLALLDGTYTPAEYSACQGWGHAHWQAAAELAARAEVRRFGLFHHRHDRKDDDLARIEAALTATAPGAFVARAGQAIALVPQAAPQRPA